MQGWICWFTPSNSPPPNKMIKKFRCYTQKIKYKNDKKEKETTIPQKWCQYISPKPFIHAFILQDIFTISSHHLYILFYNSSWTSSKHNLHKTKGTSSGRSMYLVVKCSMLRRKVLKCLWIFINMNEEQVELACIHWHLKCCP